MTSGKTCAIINFVVKMSLDMYWEEIKMVARKAARKMNNKNNT